MEIYNFLVEENRMSDVAERVKGIIIEHLEKNGGPNMTRTKGKG